MIPGKLNCILLRVGELFFSELEVVKVVDFFEFFASSCKNLLCFYGFSKGGGWTLEQSALQGIGDGLDEGQLACGVLDVMHLEKLTN